MRVLLVEVQIKPDKREEFLAAITENAEHCEKNEPGCLRFDVLQDANDPDKYWYYEVYKDEASVQAHRESEHFQHYRVLQASLIEKLTGHPTNSVHPRDDAWR